VLSAMYAAQEESRRIRYGTIFLPYVDPSFIIFPSLKWNTLIVAPFRALQEIRLSNIVMIWLVNTYFVARNIILDYNLEK